jgi:hypothetical protein
MGPQVVLKYLTPRSFRTIHLMAVWRIDKGFPTVMRDESKGMHLLKSCSPERENEQ